MVERAQNGEPHLAEAFEEQKLADKLVGRSVGW